MTRSKKSIFIDDEAIDIDTNPVLEEMFDSNGETYDATIDQPDSQRDAQLASPLLEALYDSENEAALDPETEAIRAEDFRRMGLPAQIPLLRRDATAMEEHDAERFHRMTLAWHKGHGEPKRRRVRKTKRKKTWKPRLTKSKSKKWVPRKKYLARKRKAKSSRSRK